MPDGGIMHRPALRVAWRVVLFGCTLAAAAALPAAAQADALIWEEHDQSVVLVPQDDAEAPPNDHPATVAARDIEPILADLRFRYVDDANETAPVPVFNAEQVAILGAALAAGLARATPSEDVRFSIIGAHRLSPDALVRRNRLTAGRAFFREGKLNIIFGELQSPYRKKNIYGRLEQDFYPRDYGSRTSEAEREAILVAGGAIRLGEDTDGPRHDWVVFDAGAANVPGLPAAGASNPARPGQALPAGELAKATDRATRDAIEQRLRTLKRLREEDLISEEAYRAKVDAILEEL